jgi:hypothetical protein
VAPCLAILSTIAISATTSTLNKLVAGAHGKATSQAVAIATTHGYTTAFRVSAVVSLVALVISIVVIRTPARLENQPAMVHVAG